MTKNERAALWLWLAHGEKKHQLWLKRAIDAFFDGKQRPPAE